MQATPQLRPLDLGEILDGTFRLYRSNFVTFLSIVASLLVPIALLRLLLVLILSDPATQASILQGLPGGVRIPGADWLALYTAYANSGVTSALGLLQGFVIQPLLTAALLYAVSRRYLSLPVALGEALKFGASKLIYMIAATLLLSVGTALIVGIPVFCIVFLLFGLLLGAGFASGESTGALAATGIIGLSLGAVLFLGLVIALLWLSIRLNFYPQALVVEGLGPIECLQRSWRLVAGRTWRTLGIYLVLSLLSGVLSLILVLLFIVVGVLIGVSLENPLENYGLILAFYELVQLLSSLLLQPFLLIGMTLMYYDLRVRKEGLDLELQALQPVAGSGATISPPIQNPEL